MVAACQQEHSTSGPPTGRRHYSPEPEHTHTRTHRQADRPSCVWRGAARVSRWPAAFIDPPRWGRVGSQLRAHSWCTTLSAWLIEMEPS